MEKFSYSNNLCFNFEETPNGVSEILYELDNIIGNVNSNDFINKRTNLVIRTNYSGEKAAPLFTEAESNNLLDFMDNQLDNIETHYSKIETSGINSFENNQNFVQTSLNLFISSDSNVNDNDIDRIMLNESFKKPAIKRKNKKSRISKKKGDGKDNSRRYREKKVQSKLEQKLIKSLELNDCLKKKFIY